MLLQGFQCREGHVTEEFFESGREPAWVPCPTCGLAAARQVGSARINLRPIQTMGGGFCQALGVPYKNRRDLKGLEQQAVERIKMLNQGFEGAEGIEVERSALD